MKLDPDGRKRLDAMKKALAAGLPLAGLLAAAACTKEPRQEEAEQTQRNWVYRGEVESPAELEPVEDEYVSEGLLIPPGEDEYPPPDIVTDMLGELSIAEDVSTLGILLPPDALQPTEGGGEVNWPSDDDVVVRVEDAVPAEEGHP